MAGEGNSEIVDFRVVPFDLPLPDLAAAFSQRLHAAGVPGTPMMSEQFARALALTKPVSRRRLYCVARAIFVTGFPQVPTFNRIFAEVFGKGAKRDVDVDVELEAAPPADELDSAPPEQDTKTHEGEGE